MMDHRPCGNFLPPSALLALGISMAYIVAGCSDYGIRKGDNAQIVALKKEGGKIMEIPFSATGEIAVKMDDTGIGNSVMENFEKLPNVQSVSLKNTKVGDAGLAYLKPAANSIISINLENTKVTDAGLAILKDLPNLQELVLNGTAVTDAGLEPVGALPKLKSLQLYGCKQVTDAGIQHLKGHKFDLLVLDGTAVTAKGAADLKKAVGPITWYIGP